jgi:hypothetical protein
VAAGSPVVPISLVTIATIALVTFKTHDGDLGRPFTTNSRAVIQLACQSDIFSRPIENRPTALHSEAASTPLPAGTSPTLRAGQTRTFQFASLPLESDLPA